MTDDVTAGRSAGTPRNAELDPMDPRETDDRTVVHGGNDAVHNEPPRDPTAGRAAGTAWNAEKDSMRPRRPLRRG